MLAVNFSPFPEIITDRLLLRKPLLTDAADFFEYRSNEQAMQYIGRPLAKNMEDAEKLISTITTIIDTNEGINWAITFKDNPNKVMGNIGIWQLQKENYRAEIGYMLHPNYWRQGIMQETLKVAIDFAFNKMKLHSLEAKINPANKASAKILEKNNFIKEAHFKENYFWEGQFLDTVVYSLLKK